MEVDQGHFQRIKLHKNCYDFAVQIKKVTTSLQPLQTLQAPLKRDAEDQGHLQPHARHLHDLKISQSEINREGN